MPFTVTPILLSNATAGQPVNTTSTAAGSGATLLHKTSTSTSDIDSLDLYAANNDTADQTVTIQPGTTSTAANVSALLPPSGGAVYVGRFTLTGDGTTGGSAVRSYATKGSVVNLWADAMRYKSIT